HQVFDALEAVVQPVDAQRGRAPGEPRAHGEAGHTADGVRMEVGQDDVADLGRVDADLLETHERAAHTVDQHGGVVTVQNHMGVFVIGVRDCRCRPEYD